MSNEIRSNEPAPDQAGSGSNASPAANKCGPHHCNCNRCSGKRELHFEGKCNDLKDAVCDMVTREDALTKTAHDTTKWRQFKEAGKFRTGMVDLTLPAIDDPAVPGDPACIIELWKLTQHEHEKQTKAQ